MAGIVKIDFVIGGTDAVNRAFQSLIQAAQKSGKEQVRVARETSKAVAKAQNENGNPKTAASLYAAQERAAKRAGDKEVAEAKRVAETKIKEAKRARERIESDDRKAAARTAAREEASSKEIVGRIRREGEARERREASYDRKQAALRQSQERRGQRTVYAMEHARIDDINHRRGSVRSSVGDAIKRGASTGAGVIQAGAGLVGGYLGTSTVLDAGRTQLDLGRRAALLQAQTGLSGKDGDFVGLSKSVSNVVGEDAGAVMGGLEKIAGKAGKSGVEEAKGHLLELAKIAKGAGVSMEDLGDVTATLLNRGIKGEDLAENIRMLVQQGKEGAVEFKDMATMLDASSGALLGFKMAASKRTMVAGGLTQIGRTFGKSSAAEATNAVVDVARDLGGKAKLIKKLSGEDVHVAGSKGSQLKDATDLLPNIIMGMLKKGTASNLMGEGGIFTGNSTAILQPLLQAATMGIKADKDGKYTITGEGETAEIKGREAIVKLLDQNTKASMDEAEAAKAFALVMATESEQISVAMNKLKNDLGTKLGPELAKATPQIRDFVSKFGELTIWAMSNPFKAIGALMVASMAQSMLAAGGGALFDKLLSKAIPAMAVTAGTVNVVGGPGAGLATGAAGGVPLAARVAGMNAGTILPGLAAGAAGYGVGTEVAAATNRDIAKMDTRGAALESYSIAGALNAGKGTAADRERAKALLAQMQGEQNKGVITRFGEGVTAGARGLMGGDVSLGNIASLVPPVALARGAMSATLGAQQASLDTTTTDAIKELRAALVASDETSIAATRENTAAVRELPAAMAGAINLQQPKVQP